MHTPMYITDFFLNFAGKCLCEFLFVLQLPAFSYTETNILKSYWKIFKQKPGNPAFCIRKDCSVF